MPPITNAEDRETFDCFDSILLARNELERPARPRQFNAALRPFRTLGNHSRRNVIRCGTMNLMLHPFARVALTDKL